MTQHSPSPHLAPEARQSLFETYTVPDGSYDEVFAGPGILRPHWKAVVAALDTMGPTGLDNLWEQARRMIHDHGVTYNVYGDPQGMDRPWTLDAIPWVLPSQEWARLEAALVQRVTLLNAVLADVYGPQTLVQQGLLPAELLFAHSGFLRPCHGIVPPHAGYLPLYAADLVRTAEGQWWVLADQAQSPAGAGYALENRLIVSRLLLNVFHDSQVHQLAGFFAALRQTLLDSASRHRDNPLVVLLTPGPYNETYFEHAFLARYLGYTLVEGGDLTVRDQRVFLKTLEGLQPVDVILRRLDDMFCDPLELRHDSILGTAGLVQAARMGHVAIVNALGSGWVETPALMAFLPAVCRQILGQDLALPSVPTWWCGQDEARAYVETYLERLMLFSGLPSTARTVVFGGQLSAAERRQYMAAIRERPYAYTAQQPLAPSCVPVWQGPGVDPQPMVLRAYVVATQGGYQVMPGGLTRVAAANGIPGLSRGDSRSKDTWVMSTSAPETLSGLPPTDQRASLRRSGYNFPSRAADNLLWMGRYAERAEGLVRLLRSMVLRLTDEPGLGSSAAFPALLRALQATWEITPVAPPERPLASAFTAHAQTLLMALFDLHMPGSVAATLKALHHVSALVRDYMTLESWHIVTDLFEHFSCPQADEGLQLSEALALMHRTLMILTAFSGLAVENMIRGPEWHFLDMGRRLERALHTAGLVRSTLVTLDVHEDMVLEALVEIGDSLITYRSRYRTTPQCAPVLDLLLTDETNPRAVLYQLVALAEHVEHLPRDHTMPSRSPAQRLILRALTSLQLADVAVLAQSSPGGRRSHLDTILSQILTDLAALSENITHHYLSHAELSRHLAHLIRTQKR